MSLSSHPHHSPCHSKDAQMCPSHLDPSLWVSVKCCFHRGPAFACWGCSDKGPQSEIRMSRRLGGHSTGQGTGFFLNCEGSLQQALSEASSALMDRWPSSIADVTPHLCLHCQLVFSQMSPVCPPQCNVPSVFSRMFPVCSPSVSPSDKDSSFFWIEGPRHSSMMSP